MFQSPFAGCRPCIDYCYDDFQKECEASCETAEDYDDCRKQCVVSSNECVLNNCLDPGLCCDEVCAIPPPEARSQCQPCKNTCSVQEAACESTCDQGDWPCLTNCRYDRSYCTLGCYDEGKCCDESCQAQEPQYGGRRPYAQLRGPTQYAQFRTPNQTYAQLRGPNQYAQFRTPNQTYAQLRGPNQTYAQSRGFRR